MKTNEKKVEDEHFIRWTDRQENTSNFVKLLEWKHSKTVFMPYLL